MISVVKNMDCMDAMKEFPDKYFDLACIDPPYGIGDFRNRKAKNIHKKITWNESVPSAEYFEQLYRISKNRIIFGMNYYHEFIKDKGVIVHDKTGGGKRYNPAGLSNVDIASHSFNNTMKVFHYTWIGNVQGNSINWNNSDKIHPCQKPVALYDWIYKNYLPQGGKVIDTHLGSGSNRIAAYKTGNIDFYGYELDTDYYNAQEKRFAEFTKTENLFVPTVTVTTEQMELLDA